MVICALVGVRLSHPCGGSFGQSRAALNTLVVGLVPSPMNLQAADPTDRSFVTTESGA